MYEQEQIESVVYAIKKAQTRDGVAFARNLSYGYPYKDDSNLNRLLLYKGVLERYLKALSMKGDFYLTETHIQHVLEKISNVLGGDCMASYIPTSSSMFGTVREDICIDRCNRDEWILANPHAVPREKWETLAYEVIGKLHMDISKEDILCNIAYDLTTNKFNPAVLLGLLIRKLSCTVGASLSSKKLRTTPIPRISKNPVLCIVDSNIVQKIIECGADFDLDQIEESCEIKSTINNDNIDCKHYYDILTCEYDCNLDFESYTQLIDCNISPEIISMIYQSGMYLTYSSEEGAAILHTPNASYSIDDINCKTNIPIHAVMDLIKNPDSEEYLQFTQNPQQYIIDLGSDYDLDQDLLNLLGNNE